MSPNPTKSYSRGDALIEVGELNNLIVRANPKLVVLQMVPRWLHWLQHLPTSQQIWRTDLKQSVTGKQPVAGMRWHAADFVIRRHYGANVGLLDRALERREELLAQSALSDFRRAGVGAVFRLTVARHMLQRDEHLVLGEFRASAGETENRRLAHLAADIGIFAEGFLDASPARFARHVHHRRQRQIRTAHAHLARRHAEDLGRQFGIEGRCDADRLREAGRMARHVAVQRFLVHEHRNAEAGLLHCPFLRRVDVGGGFQRRAVQHLSIIAGSAAALLRTGDALVAISQRGNSPSLVRSVKLARRGGAEVIVLAPSGTPLADLATVLIPIDLIFNIDPYTPISARLAYLVVIDVLAVGLALQRGPEFRKKMQNAQKALV